MTSISALLKQSPLIQAPLAGYSCAPFRKLAWQWGQPAFCCTEMLSAHAIARQSTVKKRYAYKDPDEGPLCVQLSGHNTETLKIASERVSQWGADLIDLNCGCPQPKIRKKHCGSYHLSQPEQLYQFIKAIKSISPLPLLAKIRVDGASGDSFNTAVAHAIEQGGADAITVHGRHWRDRYDTPCQLEQIAAIVDAVKIPVIGNGDVDDALSAKKMLDATACQGVMIARASVGQPWIFAHIKAQLAGETVANPSLAQIGEMFLQHLRELIALEGERAAILQSRKLGKYYARGQVDSRFLSELYQTENAAGFYALIKHYFLKNHQTKRSDGQ